MSYVWDNDDNQYHLGEKLTWVTACALFLDSKKMEGMSEKSLYTYRNVLDRIAKHAANEAIPVQKFGVRYMQTFLNTRRAGQVGDRTIQQDAIIAKTFFTWLWREAYFPNNNMERLKPPAVRKAVKPKIAPTSSEIRTLVDGIDKFWSDEHNPSSRFRSARVRHFFRTRDRAIVLLMADTGMRISEVFSITLDNVNLPILRITLERTKNGTTREVPVSSALVSEALEPWLAVRNSLSVDCDRLFISELGQRLQPRPWGRQLSKKLTFAGIDRNLTAHTFRRYASTVHDQIDRDAAKAIVGHKSEDAHRMYNVQEWKRIVEVHEAAGPLADILTSVPQVKEKPSQSRVVK
ncbi:MAG TPA: tyrosine-type recombinase/integrase [Capsulimonadaceae bacterium]|jgi:integrase/recombinase XerD